MLFYFTQYSEYKIFAWNNKFRYFDWLISEYDYPAWNFNDHQNQSQPYFCGVNLYTYTQDIVRKQKVFWQYCWQQMHVLMQKFCCHIYTNFIWNATIKHTWQFDLCSYAYALQLIKTALLILINFYKLCKTNKIEFCLNFAKPPACLRLYLDLLLWTFYT